ncbi:winged helix-turn-helix domain-containing protein [Pseudoclavibacter helvolus]|uniref:winged helix-turn-helix domain-containing protein n=1 Tax=Pseudoclavibacter helvolus TaxID=255205 RepID=UPI0024AC955B|nr:crosslink repair DNA glycosylase YcaQ family protein [Pseudoclavibacter helvolus]
MTTRLPLIGAAQARRIALAAQGFGARSTATQTGTRQLSSLLSRIHLLQIDSVNVWERSHYMPVFSRLGGYDKSTLDRLASGRQPRLTEYWAHEAALLPVSSLPLFGWRMREKAARDRRKSAEFLEGHAATIAWLRAELLERGPLAASEFEHEANKRRGSWWEWSDVKIVLEYLFRWGELASAPRKGFERRYALPEQVLPSEVLGVEVSTSDAVRQLTAMAAAAHGVGTTADLADYFRVPMAPTKTALEELAEAGDVLPVQVAEWGKDGKPGLAWLHRDARRPRTMDAAALLSPFDPVVWFRPRAERMHDFHYRIEIYTPAHKRVYGYYSLPILLGDAVVGRIDLKNDRQARILRVQSAWSEADAPADVAERTALLLGDAAAWQNLDDIVVADRGNLARDLSSALTSNR